MSQLSYYYSPPSPPASPPPGAVSASKPSRRRGYCNKRVIPTLQRHETLLADRRMGGEVPGLQLSFEELQEREELWASEASQDSSDDSDSQHSIASEQ